jgi:hypothetical protein
VWYADAARTQKTKYIKHFILFYITCISALSEMIRGILFTAICPFRLPDSSALRTCNKNTSEWHGLLKFNYALTIQDQESLTALL